MNPRRLFFPRLACVPPSLLFAVGWIICGLGAAFAAEPPAAASGYLGPVEGCLSNLMQYGTDRYGPIQAPILVSILDIESRQCPSNPAALDEAWRVIRRERRNPAGANLLTDVPTLKTMALLSQATDDPRYARFADACIGWHLGHLVDERGFFWWGWHRHYDVFTDKMTGQLGNPHEFHAIHEIPWAQLWAVNSNAVRREIEAVWQWHVIDKQTGEVNRHGDGTRGCDFAMAAGAYANAFAFLYRQTGERVWLDRARLLADYFWDRRNPKTDLIAERPNAGTNRFDGAHFVTSITAYYCHALLKCFELTGDPRFRDQAVSYLKAYGRYGFDAKAGKFWGSLKLDGTPVLGPRLMLSDTTNKLVTSSEAEYWIYEPRGYLDLWQPYVMGYEHPIATAQAYAYAALTTGDPDLRATAGQFARWIRQEFPPRLCLTNAWYGGYSERYAPQGTYAGLYGQTVSFFIQMYLLTGDPTQLQNARDVADEAVSRLYHHGLFRGHPGKPYYEAMDGVGQLLYALLELDRVLAEPRQALARKAIPLHGQRQAVTLPADNW